MSLINVNISGCDDQTEVSIQANEAELEFLKRLALLINDTRTYACNPGMYINGEYLETPKSEGKQK